MTNWYDELKTVMEEDGESFEEKECSVPDEELKKEFDDSAGTAEGCEFTAWGKKWVYFPVVYNGIEWIGHVPRNPCNISTRHQGRS